MEEDIKILEKLIQNITRVNEITLDCEVKLWVKEKQAIENLLTRYKQLEEENKEHEKQLKHKNDLIKQADEDIENEYIPKSKIKEKIEARESSIADIKDNFVINEGMTIEIKRLETEIDVLQELLEE